MIAISGTVIGNYTNNSIYRCCLINGASDSDVKKFVAKQRML